MCDRWRDYVTVTRYVTRPRKNERYHPNRAPKLLDVWGGYDGVKIEI